VTGETSAVVPAVAGRVTELPGLPRDEGGPVFTEAWEAEVFAITLALVQDGLFSWTEWTDALTAAIADAQRAGDPDLGDTYYHHWSAALETLCRAKGALDPADVDRRQQDWREAYERTPHGQPVQLLP
jgi:nitrile hydratase accessory protein